MNAALAAGHARTAPVKGIAKNPRPKLTRFLSAEEIERLHRVLDRLVGERPSRRQQADVVRLLLLTGCRKGEILKLQMVGGRRRPARPCQHQDRAAKGLAEPGRAGHPRPSAARRKPLRVPVPQASGQTAFGHTLHLWPRARKEAGLDDVRLHDLRHTVASQAVARGVPLSTVARMLGHADPVMTLRYAHVGDRDLQAAAERIGKAIEAAMARG